MVDRAVIWVLLLWPTIREPREVPERMKPGFKTSKPSPRNTPSLTRTHLLKPPNQCHQLGTVYINPFEFERLYTYRLFIFKVNKVIFHTDITSKIVVVSIKLTCSSSDCWPLCLHVWWEHMKGTLLFRLPLHITSCIIHQCGILNEKCSSYIYVFEHLVLKWWCYLGGGVWDFQDVEP